MTMLLWIMQTMPATRLADQDRKLDEEVVTDGGDIDKDTVEDDADEATTVEDFHNLVPTKKWRFEMRNMRKGDVVLIMYTGKSRSAEYKLGRVVAVEVDRDQLVGPCLVWYSLVQNLPRKERDSYKGVTQEDTMAAFKEIAEQE